MIWIQGGLSFLAWIAAGYTLNRRGELLQARAVQLSRAHRAILGGALFVVPALVLIGGLALLLQSGGFTANGLTVPAWLVVTLLGLTFVCCQMLGMAMLLTLMRENVTESRRPSSISRTPGDTP